MAALSDSMIVTAAKRALPQARGLWLFGSRARGQEDAASDLDLAVLLPERSDPVRLWEAGEEIARDLGMDVDLVDLRSASTVMQYQIVTTGRLLLAEGPDVERYEIFVRAEGIDLEAARAPLIADIRREGRVHGR